MNRYNEFRLYFNGATEVLTPIYRDGEIVAQKGFKRRGKTLQVSGLYALITEILKQTRDAGAIIGSLNNYFSTTKVFATPQIGVLQALQALEVMVSEGWVKGKLNPRKERITLSTPVEGEIIHTHVDE